MTVGVSLLRIVDDRVSELESDGQLSQRRLLSEYPNDAWASRELVGPLVAGYEFKFKITDRIGYTF